MGGSRRRGSYEMLSVRQMDHDCTGCFTSPSFIDFSQILSQILPQILSGSYKQQVPIFEVPPRLFYGSDLSEIWTHDSQDTPPSPGTEVSLGDVAVGSGGHSIGHESIPQAPTGLEGGLEPLWLEKLGPHRPSIVRVGPSARVAWLALLPLIALLAGSSGTATSEFRLDLIHGHRRLVGVSVNCHT